MTPVLAHGLGDPTTLPIPLPVLLVLAAGAILGLANRLSRRTPRAEPVTQARRPVPATSGAPTSPTQAAPAPQAHTTHAQHPGGAPPPSWVLVLPRWVTGVVDAAVTRGVVAVLGVVAAVVVVVLAAVGPVGRDNPAPRLVFVLGWAGLVPVALVAPGAWRVFSPLRTLWALLARATGDPGERTVRALPERWGWWPAVPGLAIVALVEARWPADPAALLVFLGLGGLALLGGAVVYGRAWFAAADPFEVFAAAVARCSPVVRDDRGRVALAAPWRTRLLEPAPPGAQAVVGVLVGAALADFLTDTGWWARTAPLGPGRELATVAALVACAAVATVGAFAATRVRPLTPALFPLVTAYGAAHYFAVLLIEGQAAAVQLAALARGGLAALAATPIVVNYEVLPATLAAVVQALLFLAPHLLAVPAGHALASARFDPRRAQRALAPLIGLLAASAVVGLALRFSAA